MAVIRYLLACTLAAGSTAEQALYDPTRPPGQQAAASTQSHHSLRLQSVLIGSDRKVAIINGRRYTEGDRIGVGTITSIQRQSVKVKLPQKTLLLRLRHKSVRQHREG